MSETGFDKYLEKKMEDANFAKEYNEVYEQVTATDDMVRQMSEQSGKKLTTLFSFKVAYPGWECDSHGCVVKDENDNRQVILTNHGAPYFATREELVNHIDRYYKLIAETTDAITVFDYGKR